MGLGGSVFVTSRSPFDGDVSETKVHAPTPLWLLVVVSVVDGGGCVLK